MGFSTSGKFESKLAFRALKLSASNGTPRSSSICLLFTYQGAPVARRRHLDCNTCSLRTWVRATDVEGKTILRRALNKIKMFRNNFVYFKMLFQTLLKIIIDPRIHQTTDNYEEAMGSHVLKREVTAWCQEFGAVELALCGGCHGGLWNGMTQHYVGY